MEAGRLQAVALPLTSSPCSCGAPVSFDQCQLLSSLGSQKPWQSLVLQHHAQGLAGRSRGRKRTLAISDGGFPHDFAAVAVAAVAVLPMCWLYYMRSQTSSSSSSPSTSKTESTNVQVKSRSVTASVLSVSGASGSKNAAVNGVRNGVKNEGVTSGSNFTSSGLNNAKLHFRVPVSHSTEVLVEESSSSACSDAETEVLVEDSSSSASSDAEAQVLVEDSSSSASSAAGAEVLVENSSSSASSDTGTATSTKDVATIRGIQKQLESLPGGQERKDSAGQTIPLNVKKGRRWKGYMDLPITIAEVLPINSTTSPELYLTLYYMLLKVGRLQDSVVLLESMDKAGILETQKMNLFKFFDACKKRRAVKEAFRFTRLIQGPSIRVFNMLLSVCSHAKDADAAWRVLGMLEKAGLKADCMFYTTLISACSKAGNVDLAFKVFNEMETAGIEANVHTFGAMIDGCARAGHLPKSFGVYGIMISKKVKPDRVIFNTLINACGRAGAVERAFDVLSDMKAEATPVTPDHVTFGALITACDRAGQVDRALEVYRTMRASRIRGTPECYTAAVHACSQNGRLKLAFTVFEDLKKDGIRPDEVFFSALVDVAGHAGQIDAAFNVLQEMKSVGMVPGVVVYSSLMGVCSNLGNWERALVVYKEIKISGLRPTVSTFNALMTALCGGKQLQNALGVLQDLRKAGVIPNDVTYSVLLKACEKEDKAELALELYTSARAEGVNPSLVMCDSLTGLCLRRVRSRSPPPQIPSPLGPLLSNNLNAPPHEQWVTWALAVYRQTIAAGGIPTIKSLARLLGCLRAAEKRRDPSFFDEGSLSLYGLSRLASAMAVGDGCGVYDPRALALFEEAAAIGVVPHFSYTAGPIVVNTDNMAVFVAEVCMLTLLKGLKHRNDAGARLHSVSITFLVQKKGVFTLNRGLRGVTIVGRTGQAVAALLRRLRLKYQGHDSSGKIRITVGAIRRLLEPTPSPQTLNPTLRPAEVGASPYSRLAKSIAEQQRAIRMGEVPPFSSEVDLRSGLGYRAGPEKGGAATWNQRPQGGWENYPSESHGYEQGGWENYPSESRGYERNGSRRPNGPSKVGGPPMSWERKKRP